MPEHLRIDDQERIPELEKLVYDVIEQGKSYGWASTAGYRATKWDGGYVRYFDIAGVPAWFGTNYHLWRNFRSPLWFGFQSWVNTERSRDQLEAVRERFGNDYLSDAPYYARNEDFVRINLPVGIEHASAVAKSNES